MPRLPTPGSDDGIWGDLLNEYLLVEHEADGSHPTSITNPDWSAVANKPGTFTPSAHSHVVADITGLGNAATLNLGTAAGTIAAGNHTHVKADIGLGNVDNTADIDKPVSTAMQNALNLKADQSAVEALGSLGKVWTAQGLSEGSWSSIAYGNGLFVAVNAGLGDKIATSPDGVTWTARTAPENNAWHSVTYGNGLFVAVARNGTNRVMTSSDGGVWTSRSAAAQHDWVSVTYGNGLFVAVAYGGGNQQLVMTSPDGAVWTSQGGSMDDGWWSVTYGNGLFVAVAIEGDDRVMTSPDGETWTVRGAPAVASWYAVAYGGGTFVALDGGVTATHLLTSPDGITWTAGQPVNDNQWQSLAYANGLFVATAAGGSSIEFAMTSGKPLYNVPQNNNTYQGGKSVYGGIGIGMVGTGSGLAVAGPGIFTGTVTAANPTDPNHAATKHYVDTKAQLTEVLTLTVDGGGIAITPGEKGHLAVPFDGEIQAVSIVADQAGDVVLDLWKTTYANYPGDVSDSITASAPPTLAGQQKIHDAALAGWARTVAAGDIITVLVDSVSTVTRFTVSLILTRN